MSVEGRLGQAMRPQPDVSLVGHESIADDRLQLVGDEGWPLEIAVVVVQDVFDVVGMD